MKKITITKLLIVLLFFFTFSVAKAQDVLIIYDDSPTNTNTVSLANALTTAGLSVTLSDVSESNWDNTSPSITGFEAIIHLNGTTYSSEMPSDGQIALKNFVQNNNGLYIGFEWNSYQVDEAGQMQDMIDLVLYNRSEVIEETRTLNVVPAQSGHPIMKGVSATFNIAGAAQTGGIRVFASNPSIVIMTHDTNAYDAVAMRSFGNGHVLGFCFAPNWDASSTSLSSPEIQKIIVNFINEYYTTNTLSIDNPNLKTRISMYPNPATEFIKLSGLTKTEKYGLFNISGKEMNNGNISNNEKLDIQNLNDGFYFMRFDNGNTIKFIKK